MRYGGLNVRLEQRELSSYPHQTMRLTWYLMAIIYLLAYPLVELVPKGNEDTA